MDAHLEQNKLARTRKTARGVVEGGGGGGGQEYCNVPRGSDDYGKFVCLLLMCLRACRLSVCVCLCLCNVH